MNESQTPFPWQAEWIWGGGEESPRNEWRCFRQSLQTSEQLPAHASLKITADSRYVLYVNGEQVGRGPVRSWPFELAYDEYEISHLLKADTDNVIAVLVMHYGVSTFQYLRGRGGLLVQVHTEDQAQPLLITDASWKTAIHEGFDPTSSRISCQLAFTEIIDARKWNEAWTTTDFNDTDWNQAVAIGAVGMKPWTTLVERSIPYLTEEPRYPERVEALQSVKPVPWSAVFDLRNLFDPESANHANNITFIGYLATQIRVEKPTKVTLGSVDHGRASWQLSVNGTWLEPSAFTGEPPEQSISFDLLAGNNLIMLSLSGNIHGHGFHLGIDCDEPFSLHLPEIHGVRAGAANESLSAFVSIGPFDLVEQIDHQPPLPFREDHPDFVRARGIANEADLADFKQWIKPVSSQLVSLNDVFSACVWKKSSHTHPVPHKLQNAVIPGPDAAVVPIYPDLDTELTIDFGQELTGYLVFEVEAPAGTIIDLYGYEYQDEGQIQHTYQLDNTLRYVCREGRQVYTSLVRRGLRYLSFTVREAAAPIKVFSVKMLQSNYPVAEVGRFKSSDPLLNDIWQISQHTTRLCMEDTFVDCPAFEQAYWVGDARNEALINYYLFGSREIVEHCLRLVPGSSFQSPLYVDQVPSGWNSVIPNWTFFWVTACLEYSRFSGDQKFAADMWPHIKFTLEHYLTKLDEQGLLNMQGWNLLDWAAFEQPRSGVVTPQNMFLVKALRDGAELAKTAGDESGGLRFFTYADELSGAINTYLWNHERNAYIDCIHTDGRLSATTSMQTQVVAVLCDIAEGDRKQVLEQYLVQPPSSFVQIGSPFMSFFYYEALAKMGRMDLLLADMRKQYGAMIDLDASTCWEMYPAPGSKWPTRSHCHAWSAGPAYFLGAYILGVRGESSGWTKVIVAPEPTGLTWAKGTVPLPSGGRIDVSWQVEHSAKQIKLRLAAPQHIEIDVQAPDGYEITVHKIDIG
jgi:alpha-L-rhamnosidase